MWCRIGLWIARGEFSDPCLGSDPPCGMQSHPYSGWLKLTNKSGVFFASGPERHLGWGGVSDPLFTTLLSLQWSNAIQQKHPRALSSRPRGFFSPWKINLILKQPCVCTWPARFLWTSSTPLTNWEMPKSQQKSIKCYNFGRKKLLCFLTCTANSGSNLSLWLRTCHNNLFLFFRKEEQHLALLQLWLIWKICKLTCNLIKMTWSH